MAIRLIVAGAGSRGREWIHELGSDPRYRLAGVADPDPAALGAAVAAGVPRELCFTSFDELVSRSDADAALVATPPDAHVTPSRIALEAGLSVLVEKPFATRLDDAAALVDLAERKQRPLLVAQNYRHMRAWRAARDVVASGRLGKVGFVAAHYYRVPHAIVPSLAALEHRVLWGAAVHHLDALRRVVGPRVAAVSADSFTLSAPPRGGSLQILLEFEGGARMSYSATYESTGHEYFERGQEFYVRLTGDRATLHMIHRWLFLCERGRLPRWVGRGSRSESEERVILSAFANAIAGGDDGDAGGRENLETMALLEACVLSSGERRWIDPRELLRAALASVSRDAEAAV